MAIKRPRTGGRVKDGKACIKKAGLGVCVAEIIFHGLDNQRNDLPVDIGHQHGDRQHHHDPPDIGTDAGL